MKFYHYTAVTLGESILSSALDQGHLLYLDNSIQHGVAWLTTDPSWEHHGLPTGNESLTPAQIRHRERVVGAPRKNALILDKTRLRLGVDLDPDQCPGLISFMDWSAKFKEPTFAKLTGLSARFDLSKYSGAQLKKMLKSEATKERTWWLSFTPVAAHLVRSVDFKTDDGGYVPYDFETHGRELMRKAGIVIPSTATVAELADLLPSSHTLEFTKALTTCTKGDADPMVLVRGGGRSEVFYIANGQHVAGIPDSSIPLLQAWVGRHREELMSGWQEAIELYYTVYPEHRR